MADTTNNGAAAARPAFDPDAISPREFIGLREYIEMRLTYVEARALETQRTTDLAIQKSEGANREALNKASETTDKAIAKASESSERALQKATESTDKAILKAEEANNKRLDSLSESQQILNNQTRAYVTQGELQALREAHATKIEALQKIVYMLTGGLAVIQILLKFVPTPGS